MIGLCGDSEATAQRRGFCQIRQRHALLLLIDLRSYASKIWHSFPASLTFFNDTCCRIYAYDVRTGPWWSMCHMSHIILMYRVLAHRWHQYLVIVIRRSIALHNRLVYSTITKVSEIIPVAMRRWTKRSRRDGWGPGVRGWTLGVWRVGGLGGRTVEERGTRAGDRIMETP